MERSVTTGEWRLVEGQDVEEDALGHVNSVLVVGEQEKVAEGALEEEEEGESSLPGGDPGKKLGKGDFEQTLEVSLNDTPADANHFNILHSEVNVNSYNYPRYVFLCVYHRPMPHLGYVSTSPTISLTHLWT